MRLLLLCALVPCIGCFGINGGVDVKGVETALAAASSLGQAGLLAMNAMGSTTPVACTSVQTSCGSYPCTNGAVAINYGADCPLPLGGQVSGSVNVSGSWMSASQAQLSTTFVNVMAGSHNSTIVSATSLSVTRSSSQAQVSYTGQNVNVQGASALAGQSSWMVSITSAGAPGANDTYTITGAQQAGGNASGSQIVLTDVVLSPSCRLNPTAGSAVVQSGGLGNIEDETINFHSACDGKADVQTTTGGRVSAPLVFFQ